ncbi:serine/threonine-protein kinase [Streptomyces sp. NPDC004609]|uniref:serine/threonine-protein kinase n=1 Tax=Streptomyces sp. NPDC004609 TaxID=3364704 RepID=UPI0036859990
MGARVPENQLIAGRYRLLSPLGEGGMGVVWRARDEVLDREVAVKEVRAPAGLGATEERRLYQRLEREAWAAGRISHRNVVTVFDVAVEDGRPWIVMELIRGLSLAEVLESDGPLVPRRAAQIGTEVLAALNAAHGAGVLHRDVKPGNVLIANDGRVVLSDFGIAVVEGTSHLTMTGELIGSPEFLAPERALGRTPGPESDLWSLGVLLYAAVEGISPFRQNTPLSTLRAVVDEELPPPRRAGELAPVIAGLLRKEPAERMPAAEAERQLRLVGAGGSTRTAVPPGPYSPTVSARTTAATPAPGPPAPGPATPAGGPATTTGLRPPPHSRRSVAVLATGIAVLLLAVSGLAWALMDRDGGGADRGGGGVSSGGVSSPKETPPPSPSGGGGTTAPGGGGTDDGGTGSRNTGGNNTPPPDDRPQTVTVHVQAVRDEYSGTCPPPDSGAPAFRAQITVGRTPATVEYRWATESGDGSYSRWRTLTFPSGGERQKAVEHTEQAYPEAGTRHDRIRVEVRSPVEARSAWIGFSVTCVRETPSDGVSRTPDTGAGPAVRRAR